MLKFPQTVVGVLGGGQLGRMMAYKAHQLGIKLVALDPKGEASPTGQVVQGSMVEGKFDDFDKCAELVKQFGCDVVTCEIEHVNTAAMQKLEQEGKVQVQPASRIINVIQDKYDQKVHLRAQNIALPDFEIVESVADIAKAAKEFGYPMMLKSRRLAYDGRGNCVVKTADDAKMAFEKLGGDKGNGLYVERWAEFTMELAVMVARSVTGEVACYPTVETVQVDNICHTVIAPAAVSPEVYARAQELAVDAIKALGEGATGVFGVEMFLLKDKSLSTYDSVVLNEIAPRPHNSGHYTQEACYTDQFEQHLRAIIGLPLGDCSLKVGACVMQNVLGSGDMNATMAMNNRALTIPGASVHWYGKGEDRKGRKMGHINIVGPNVHTVLERVDQLNGVEKQKKAAGSGVGQRPLVGVIMGSDSDLPTMKAAAVYLEKFDVPFELTVVSAHRTPERMFEYAKTAHTRGLQVIIAGAGGAAHLPGMVAAMTPLPVVGVPVKTSTLSGNDSLLSIVQMPRGVPVATVAIGNSTNAALLAVRILASSGAVPGLMGKLQQFHNDQREEVEGKASKLEGMGYSDYLAQMPPKH